MGEKSLVTALAISESIKEVKKRICKSRELPLAALAEKICQKFKSLNFFNFAGHYKASNMDKADKISETFCHLKKN